MFDITSSKLLLLGIVALLVIGPKDFPALLRTIGKYVGIVRGHAKEFRAQFDEAMRESELADLKKDVENIARETEASLQATGQTVESSLNEARQSIDTSIDTATKPPPDPVRARCRRDPDCAAAAGHRDQQSERVARRRSTGGGHLGRDHDPDGRRAATPGREEWRLKG